MDQSQSMGSMLVGIVATAVVQEVVSRGFSYVLGKRKERASMGMGDALEKLELAHSQLEFVLERSSKLPITNVSLLRRRMMIKHVYHECDVLLRSKRHALNDHHSSSFPLILGAVRSSASSFFGFGMNKLELSHSAVQRFESFADKAGEFMRDVECGCTLVHYRFFNPLITQLFQGHKLHYEMVQASRIHVDLRISPLRSEEHGVVAFLVFSGFDAKVPANCFDVELVLRLSEDMDIVGIAIQCLESLGPRFKSLAQVAIRELSQLPTQDMSDTCLSDIDNRTMTSCLYRARPDPLCCKANVLQRACADKVIPYELLSYRFAEQLLFMRFECEVSAFDQYNVQSSADKADRNAVNGWPLLKVQAIFLPHSPKGGGEIRGWQTIGEQREDMNGTSVQQMGEMVLTNAITCFIRQPELTDYRLDWVSPHGAARFVVEKPLAEVQSQDLLVKRIRLLFLSEDV